MRNSWFEGGVIVAGVLAVFALGWFAGNASGPAPSPDTDQAIVQLQAELANAKAEQAGLARQVTELEQAAAEIRSQSTILLEPSAGGQVLATVAGSLLGSPGLGRLAAGALPPEQDRWVIPMKVTPQVIGGQGVYKWCSANGCTGPYQPEAAK